MPNDANSTSIVEQRENESAWRQLLVQGVLVVLLPTEDLENACLRSLVAEIFAEMIIGSGVSGKACEGWLLWEGITRAAEVLQTDRAEEKDIGPDDGLQQLSSRPERHGSFASLTDEGGRPLLRDQRRHPRAPTTITALFWAAVKYAWLASTALSAAIVAIATSSSLPRRSGAAAGGRSAAETTHQSRLAQASPATRQPPASKRPIVSMRLWGCASKLVELDARMPWLSGLLSMLHWGALLGPGRVGDTDGVLDR